MNHQSGPARPAWGSQHGADDTGDWSQHRGLVLDKLAKVDELVASVQRIEVGVAVLGTKVALYAAAAAALVSCLVAAATHFLAR